MVKMLLRSLFVALAAAILLEGFHLTNLLGPEHVDLEKSLALMLLGLGLVIQAFRKEPLPRGFLRPRAERNGVDCPGMDQAPLADEPSRCSTCRARCGDRTG